MKTQELTEQCIATAGGVGKLSLEINCHRSCVYMWLKGTVPQSVFLKAMCRFLSKHDVHVHLEDVIH